MRFPIRKSVALRSTLAALLLGLAVPRAALAADGYVNGYVNLRAGPSARYPRVFTLPPGTPVAIYGCTSGYGWCDVRGDGMRGWIAAEFVSYPWDNRRVVLSGYGARIGLPIVNFVLDAYWGDHYRDQPWYGERARWARPGWRQPPPPPPPGRWGYRPGPPPGGWNGPQHDRHGPPPHGPHGQGPRHGPHSHGHDRPPRGGGGNNGGG